MTGYRSLRALCRNENILADFGIIRYYKAKVLITLIKNPNYLLHPTGNHFHNLCLLTLTTLSR